MLVGLDKYVDWVLPALQPHSQDTIKPWGMVSWIKGNIPTPSSKRIISSKFEEIWEIDENKTLELYGIKNPTLGTWLDGPNKITDTHPEDWSGDWQKEL